MAGGIRAWLGPSGRHATDHQVGNIEDAQRGSHVRWTDPEDRDLREAALVGAASIALGDERLTAIAARWHRLQREALRAQAQVEGGIYAASLNGATATQISRESGLPVETIEKILRSW